MTDPTQYPVYPDAPVGHPQRPDLPPQRAPEAYPPQPGAPLTGYHAPQIEPVAAEVADEPWAPWWRRVLATVLDALLGIPFVLVMVIGGSIMASSTLTTLDGTPTAVDRPWTFIAGLVVVIAAGVGWLVFGLWNTVFRQGRRGWSLGKQAMGIIVVGVGDGRPIGAMLTFVRSILHLLDSIPLGLGYLWPLLDPRKQTFADKAIGTCVLYLEPIEPRVPQQRQAW